MRQKYYEPLWLLPSFAFSSGALSSFPFAFSPPPTALFSPPSSQLALTFNSSVEYGSMFSFSSLVAAAVSFFTSCPASSSFLTSVSPSSPGGTVDVGGCSWSSVNCRRSPLLFSSPRSRLPRSRDRLLRLTEER